MSLRGIWEEYQADGNEYVMHSSVQKMVDTHGESMVATEFAQAAESLMSEEELIKMLSVGPNGQFETAYSFVGLLLKEEALQPSVIDMLLEKLSEYSAMMEVESMEKNVPKLILRELRWMDIVVEPRKLVEKLLEALPVFAPALQKEIIYILPEIASDESSELVIESLLELIRAEESLVVSCIEALSNFNEGNEQTERVLVCVLERLDSSPLTDLPAVVKYLVQETPVGHLENVVDDLCDKVSKAVSFGGKDMENNAMSESTNASSESEESLIVASISQAFRIRSELLQVFFARLEAEKTVLTILDVWLIAAIHSIPHYQQKVEKMIKKKIQSSQLTSTLLIESIVAHASAFEPHFSSMLRLASTLLSTTSGTKSSEMGKLLFELLFEELASRRHDGSKVGYHQDQVVMTLLGHALAHTTAASASAIDTLSLLVAVEPSYASSSPFPLPYSQTPARRRSRLKLFLPSLKQLLDILEVCGQKQARQIYELLFAIGGQDETELCTLMRKQCFHQDLRYRYMGILAAIARLESMLVFFRERAKNNSEEERVSFEEQSGKAFSNCLTELHESCLQSAECMRFMLDELARLVRSVKMDRLAQMLIYQVFEQYMEMLEARFMLDFDFKEKEKGKYQKMVLDGSMKSELWFGLDDKKCPVYLRILDLVLSPNVSDQDSLLYLNSLLLAVLTSAQRLDQLSEIECVLICPLQMVEPSILDEVGEMETEVQDVVCLTFWHAIQWMRSVLNFFTRDETPSSEYYKNKIPERLENLVQLETSMLEKLLPRCSTFIPPRIQTSLQSTTTTQFSKTADGKGKGKKALSGFEDRVEFVRSSFTPLRVDVVNILTYPRFYGALAVLPSSGMTSSLLDDLPLIHILVRLLVEYASGCLDREKKKKSMPFLRHAATDALRGTGVEDMTTRELLQKMYSSRVLLATGAYARHVLAFFVQAEEEEIDYSLDPCAKLLQEYLSLVLIFSQTQVQDTMNSHKPLEKIVSIQQLQVLLLPEKDRLEYATPDVDLFKRIVQRCFDTVLGYKCTVRSELSSAAVLLKSLRSLLGLLYGYDASLVLSYCKKLRLSDQGAAARVTGFDMSKNISELAYSYLEKNWAAEHRKSSKFSYKSADLDLVLRCYIEQSPVALDAVETLAVEGFMDMIERGSDQSITFSTLTGKTIIVYHRVMLDTLVAATVRLDMDAVVGEKVGVALNYLLQAALLFQLLVAVTKSYQKPALFSSVLKHGRRFIEMVLSVMPFLEDHFRDENERVIKVIATVQMATRRMQVLCAHGKLVKDKAASAQVPMVKKLLEKLIYRSEQLATANGVLDAYTMGVLKNRRLDGTTISKDELEKTQESEESESEEEEDDGESTGEEE